MPQYIIAVDLGGTQIRAALCDPSGQVFKRAARATKAQEGLEAVLARIGLTIEEAAEGVAEESIAGIGIGAPGPLDPMTGTILAAPNLPGWINVPLRNLISARFGKCTFLGNDANLAGLAETIYGAARGVSDVVYLTISTGIGSGIIVDGRLLLGAAVSPPRPVTPLSIQTARNAAAATTAASNRSRPARQSRSDVVARLKAGKSSKLTKLCGGDLSKVDTRMINEAAQAGDKLAVNAFRRAGSYLGLGIVNLLHLFNPRMVVLGGSVTKAGPLLFDPMWETIRAKAMPPYLEGLAIVPAALSDDVGLLGALALAATELKIERG